MVHLEKLIFGDVSNMVHTEYGMYRTFLQENDSKKFTND